MIEQLEYAFIGFTVGTALVAAIAYLGALSLYRK
jgi:hypothetical protein